MANCGSLGIEEDVKSGISWESSGFHGIECDFNGSSLQHQLGIIRLVDGKILTGNPRYFMVKTMVSG